MATSIQLAAQVPVLETERLRLRGHGVADFEACRSMWADPIVTRFIGGRPFTGEEAWSRLLRYVGHWALLGFGYWVVEEKATGGFIGEVGFADYRREMTGVMGEGPEIGWVFVPEAHGRGYATEAVGAVVTWGDERFEGAPTHCIINPENRGSIRVAEKCGYRELGRTVYHGAPTLVFVRKLNRRKA